MKTIYGNEPVDYGFNCAVRTLAKICCPSGWDQVKTFDEAPTTLEALLAYAKEHDRLCIAEEDSVGTIYADEETNWHLRAWHDSVHYRHLIAFTAAGEAAVVYVQVAQLYRRYYAHPREQLIRWGSLLLADILGLVHYHQRTGLWPKNKRQGTVNEAHKWEREAAAILDECTGIAHETKALAKSAAKWGYPYDFGAALEARL